MDDIIKNENPALSEEYKEIIDEAAKLPESEQKKIAFFISGYMAAQQTKDAAAV